MLDELLVQQCAPTLAGMKTGNIFTVRSKDRNEAIHREIRELNVMLTKKGLRMIPLCEKQKNTILYLYRPDRLEQDLMCPDAADILKEKGYPCDDPNRCVMKLIGNLKSSDDSDGFPHEIGLFLGYPPCDVKGFMKDSREGVKCVGCWKVYGDEKAAQKTFAKYKKCTKVYCEKFLEGGSLERLAVKGK